MEKYTILGESGDSGMASQLVLIILTGKIDLLVS